MRDSKKSVTLLFRKRSSLFNSIEEIFENLYKKLNSRVNLQKVQLPNFSNGWLNKFKNVFFVSGINTPMLHITGEIYYTGLLFRGKLMVTVHDLGSLNCRNPLKRFFIKTFWFQLIARKARIITTISEFSRQNYLQNVKVDESKVKVVYNPVPPGLNFNPKETMPDKPLILHLGTKANKNLHRLAEALTGINCTLQIIGKLSEKDKSILAKNSIEYENKFGLEFDEVIQEYERCDLVSFVSTFEGFGMPVIEAQAIGRPVITSTVTSLPEVAGEGALLVDPFSINEIRDGILQIIENQPLRKKLIEKGKENTHRFQLDKIAADYLKLYNEVCDND